MTERYNNLMKISVVIPAYNEMQTIRKILARVQNTNRVAEILVVDDGSTDGTRDVLKEAGWKRIHPRDFTREEPGKRRGCHDWSLPGQRGCDYHPGC